MKERKIKILISLMTIALLGLIGLQYYLIRNLVRIEKERFNRLVSESLNSVTFQIDKLEAASAVRDELLLNLSNQKPDSSVIETEIVRINSRGNTKKHEKYVYEFNSGNDTTHSFVFFSKDDTAKIDSEKEESIFIDKSKDTIYISRYNLVNEVVTELFNPKETEALSNRLEKVNIDSLLNAELNDRGIDIKHWFGITQNNNKIVLSSQSSDSMKIFNSNYSVRLFPDNILGDQSKLKVYFSGKSSYLLGNIAGMLGLSILFIITIGFIFAQSIRMLLRQKKITEVKNDLINNITHEFKTPLSTISIASEALSDPAFNKDDVLLKKYTGMISTENKRLTAMVESLLNTAAFESGNYKLKMEPLSIHSVIEKVVSTISEFLSSHSANITFNFMADKDNVKADVFHLSNVFKNLIENAVKYCETSPKIEIKSENNNSSIIIFIKDNGIGIAKEHQKRIFDTFYRVPTGNIHNVKGNGIGLSYVKKMVEAHSGKVELKSKLGSGSTFVITLPVLKNE